MFEHTALRPPSREHSAESRAQIAAIAARRQAAQRLNPKPVQWLKPAYGSEQYRYALAMGWITDEEHRANHQENQARRARAQRAAGTQAQTPARWDNPAPAESRQYGSDYSTEAARDSRLSMGAKALLQIIRARCGRTMQTAFTKGTMANCVGRSTRTVQRYIGELERFGYIATEIRKGWRGLHSGLIVRISEKVRPFYARHEALAAWMAGQGAAMLDRTGLSARKASVSLGFTGRTELPPTNLFRNTLFEKGSGIGLSADDSCFLFPPSRA